VNWRAAVLAATLSTCVLCAPLLVSGAGVGVAAVAMLVCAAVFAFVEAAIHPHGDGGEANWAATATGLMLLAGFWLGLALPGTAPGQPIALGVLGGGVMIAGISLRAAAMLSLGERFRSQVNVAPGQEMVTRGIYRRSRHPSEFGLLLISLGAAVLLASLAALAVWALILTPLVVMRVRAEEELLRLNFGDAYRAYACRVPMFFGII